MGKRDDRAADAPRCAEHEHAVLSIDPAELANRVVGGKPDDAHRGGIARLHPSGQFVHSSSRYHGGLRPRAVARGPEALAGDHHRPAIYMTCPLTPERAGQRNVRRDPALGDVPVDRVDAGELELDADLILAGVRQLDRLDLKWLAVLVQAGGAHCLAHVRAQESREDTVSEHPRTPSARPDPDLGR